jgi:hypothetical protein
VSYRLNVRECTSRLEEVKRLLCFRGSTRGEAQLMGNSPSSTDSIGNGLLSSGRSDTVGLLFPMLFIPFSSCNLFSILFDLILFLLVDDLKKKEKNALDVCNP